MSFMQKNKIGSVLITDEDYDGEFCLQDYDFSLHDLKGKTYKEIIFRVPWKFRFIIDVCALSTH